MTKKVKIELSWKQCEAIARYYEFPSTVLLLKEEDMLRMLKGTRRRSVRKRFDKLRKKLRLIALEIGEVV